MKSNYATHRSYAEINLQALKKNYQYLRSLAPDSQFLGVVKADAYGHGALPIARALVEFGAEMLAVACVSEAVTLREAGIETPILILGDTPKEQIPVLFQYQLVQTVHDLSQGNMLAREGELRKQKVPVHLKLDTGMGRLGFQPHQREQILEVVALPWLKWEGIYTHFAQSEGKSDNAKYYTNTQYHKFRQILTVLENRGIHFPLRHCANSGATLQHPHTHLDMIRAGIALYGYSPDGTQNKHLHPVLKLYSNISALRPLPKGTPIGYGSTECLTRDSLIAVVPVGYGDGYPRLASNGGMVLIHEVCCPIVGRVCMDMMMVDVTSLLGQEVTLEVGDEVILYGCENLLEETALKANTISYELLCNLSPRLPRIVKELDLP